MDVSKVTNISKLMYFSMIPLMKRKKKEEASAINFLKLQVNLLTES